MLRRAADALSWALHPFLLPLYLVVVLLTYTPYASYPGNMKFYLVWVILLYGMFLPALCLGLLHAWGRVSDWRVDRRRERMWPLVVGAVCYLLCAVTLAKFPSAAFLRKFMVAAACCEARCLFVSFYLKISLHLTAMGAAVALMAVLNFVDPGCAVVPLLAAVLGAGALASARLYLGCHNGLQVAAGFCGGFAVAVLSLLFA